MITLADTLTKLDRRLRVELELNIKVTGSSMYEISDKLSKLAGEMLMARIVKNGPESVVPEGLNIINNPPGEAR